MEDIKILEAVERYILGQMNPDAATAAESSATPSQPRDAKWTASRPVPQPTSRNGGSR